MESGTVADFVDGLQQRGRYCFVRREVRDAYPNLSSDALKMSLLRLSKRRRIALVRGGFYVIVPLEYRVGGILPAEWFISDLMKYVGQQYYVGLLSAAAIHGASHQQPQEFQIVVPDAGRPIESKSLKIRFFKKLSMGASHVIAIKTPAGYMHVSDPAVTAIDLVSYADRIGGLNRVYTVLKELKPKITADMLLRAARKERRLSSIQRLGWLLVRAGHDAVAQELAEWLRTRSPRETPLEPSSPRKGFSRSMPWKVIVNADVEIED